MESASVAIDPVIASEAKQSRVLVPKLLDCFVALLLAMTKAGG
jgi:hypothetical protein